MVVRSKMTAEEIFAEIENFISDYKENYSVYKLTDPEGKVYIGYCIGDPEQRWCSGNGYKNNHRFFAAIKHFGWRSISREIVAAGLTLTDARRLERELIIKYESTDPQKGYNIRLPKDEENPKHYSVYLIICAVNNKMYVGYTGRKPEVRWKNGRGYRFNESLTADIQRYGWDYFRTTVVAKNVDEETARNFEYYLVRYYDLQNPEKGYNLNNGGFFGAKGRVYTPEQRKRRSEISKAAYKRDDEYRKQRAREATLGTHRTEAEKKNLSEKLGKKVLCVETGEVYCSIREAYRQTGIHYNCISRACNGTRETAGKLHWKYV